MKPQRALDLGEYSDHVAPATCGNCGATVVRDRLGRPLPCRACDPDWQWACLCDRMGGALAAMAVKPKWGDAIAWLYGIGLYTAFPHETVTPDRNGASGFLNSDSRPPK